MIVKVGPMKKQAGTTCINSMAKLLMEGRKGGRGRVEGRKERETRNKNLC